MNSSDSQDLSQDSAWSDSAESENAGRSDQQSTSRSANKEYVCFEIEDDLNRRLILSEDMSAYQTKKFSIFISDKLLNKKILEKYPVPSKSAVQAPKLDDYVPQIFSATG